MSLLKWDGLSQKFIDQNPKLFQLEDKMTLDRLRMYKTAFSKTYGNYIEIKKVYSDDLGEPIIVGRPANTDQEILFRECELSEFCF